ncbi:unnamed protein product [Malus baccata var. baccata]|uniref:Uncharacterized protein n=1 Tax=Malus domestica TaxID=3750 RepID=A0A498KFD5_MALDO|nr:hypothetical protein DVH24_018158 [Malus domestica]
MILLLPYSDTRFIGVADASGEGLRNDLELVRSSSEKHLELLRPSARLSTIFKGTSLFCRAVDHGIVSDVLDLLNRKR